MDPARACPRWAFAAVVNGERMARYLDHPIHSWHGSVGPRNAIIAQVPRGLRDDRDKLGVGGRVRHSRLRRRGPLAAKEAGAAGQRRGQRSRIDDSRMRARMVETFNRGLTQSGRLRLPIQPWNAAAREWHWSAKNGNGALAPPTVLAPGDARDRTAASDGLAAGSATPSYPHVQPQDQHKSCPACRRLRTLRVCENRKSPDFRRTIPPGHLVAPRSPGSVRTAMTIEPRDGIICVFMPPLSGLKTICAAAVVDGPREETNCPITSRATRPPTLRRKWSQ